MVLEQTRRMTVEEFDQFVLLPENANRNLEFIAGEIVEVVSNDVSSGIAAMLLGEIYAFNKVHQLGRVTGADGGYMVAGERYIPDVGFISKARQPAPTGQAYNPLNPDLAVEVLSPSNDLHEIRRKVVNYLRAGTTVWLFNPDKKQVEVYAPNQPVKVLGIDDTLDGGDVLPGFTLAVKEIFPV